MRHDSSISFRGCGVLASLFALACCGIMMADSARAIGDETRATTPKKSASAPGRGEEMNYGPFLSFTVLRPEPAGQKVVHGGASNGDPRGWRPVQIVDGIPEPARTDAGELAAVRGIAVKVADDAAICFDADLLSYSAGWTGGFLDLSHTDIAQYKGDQPARIRGDLQFGTIRPGWGKAGDFTDHRLDGQGPMPMELGRYRGLYRNGQKVVFAYSFAKAEILDLPGGESGDGQVGFTRTIRIGKSETPISLNIFEADRVRTARLASWSEGTEKKPVPAAEEKMVGDAANSVMSVLRDGIVTKISIVNAPAGATLELADEQHAAPLGALHPATHHRRVQLNLPALAAPVTFKVLIVTLPPGVMAESAIIQKAAAKIEDVKALCHGGPALWGNAITTQGSRGTDTGAYAVDAVRLPEDNPFKAWMRTTAVDFFSDGRAAVATFGGDVWIVSGLDDSLNRVAWKRFATGLYEPLGLKIVDDQIYVLGRDQITRLYDLNNDGEADFYENFCNAWVVSPAPHGFNLDLQADSAGNFYFGDCGNSAPLNVRMQQSLLKVSKYGRTCDVFATGLRAPNGFGMGPHDEVVFSDNQGHWTPVCRINLAKQGGFYGFVADPARSKLEPNLKIPRTYDPPLCWIPMNIDNSTGGQVWAGDKWGAMSGQMLSTSYGMSALYEVIWEKIDGIAQGGVVKLPLKFESGIMRARVNPKDGQVWVTGMKGWQTNARRDGCLQRVRATGKPAHMPVALHIGKRAISITFSDPLDAKIAVDEQSYGIEQWNYRWTGNYGSPDLKPSDPKANGHDEVAIKSVSISADHKTITLQIPDSKPVMQMMIQMHVAAADGTAIESEIYNTINKTP
ncbi:MAG TPA: DUF6797 domain-containing protein [Tepidisphaeraceae bacterium]|jgi:glucose/arabinose dehydrogenase|nr:DUF6797 domain-containing protein [Tepidisphaeraceae bacterium]